MPVSVHSMSWSAGPMKRMLSRTASAPYRSTSSSGPATFPFVFDIFEPPICTHPWWNRRANGSRNPTRPMSFSAFTKKRAYSRCPVVWSIPPMYCDTGSQ